MAKTDNFRQQHDELLQLAKRLSAFLNAEQLGRDAQEARSILSTIAGKLKVHLAMEDNALYPRLLEHKDAQVRSLASRFMREMGGIKETFENYLKKWPSFIQIKENPEVFIYETKGVFAAVADRIDRENDELYSLVDRL